MSTVTKKPCRMFLIIEHLTNIKISDKVNSNKTKKEEINSFFLFYFYFFSSIFGILGKSCSFKIKTKTLKKRIKYGEKNIVSWDNQL